ncbi:hypothetical protein FRX31_027929 [Thalictrum thalictroides]|uniref:Uncharacterized protein n=1 Tax=Thalictrum thalictroides TaxID=46969 RepID=A0A7J6VBM7_THATH|nr:hypothetical protein FRX31_027929 [Thalictrum thalictroides]
MVCAFLSLSWREVLNFYGLAPGQVVGNFWRFMYCFYRMEEAKYDVTLKEIRYVNVTFTTNRTPRHYYFILKQRLIPALPNLDKE